MHKSSSPGRQNFYDLSDTKEKATITSTAHNGHAALNRMRHVPVDIRERSSRRHRTYTVNQYLSIAAIPTPLANPSKKNWNRLEVSFQGYPWENQ